MAGSTCSLMPDEQNVLNLFIVCVKLAGCLYLSLCETRMDFPYAPGVRDNLINPEKKNINFYILDWPEYIS